MRDDTTDMTINDASRGQVAEIKRVLAELLQTHHLHLKLKRKNQFASVSVRIFYYLAGLLLLGAFPSLNDSNWPKSVVGALLITLTYLTHHWRPHVKFFNSQARIIRLNRAIYTAKTAIESNHAEQIDYSTVLRSITKSLDEVRRMQHLDYAIANLAWSDMMRNLLTGRSRRLARAWTTETDNETID